MKRKPHLRAVPLLARPGSAAGSEAPSIPSPAGPPAARSNVIPLPPRQFEVRFVIDEETLELLTRAMVLMGLVGTAGDVADVFHRALALLVDAIE